MSSLSLGRFSPTPLELAFGFPFGTDISTEPLAPSDEHPRAAIERMILRHLERQPCLVSFSGGRDSSAVLALTTHVSRREGFPDPIPVTNRFPKVPESDETSWQELVVQHLGLQEWVRLELTDELDVLGRVATGALSKHGVLPIFNSHFHTPVLEQAVGGTVLTGAGGDEVFAPVGRALAARVRFAQTVRPSRKDLRQLTTEFAPRSLRVRHAAGSAVFDTLHWLRPEAKAQFATAYSRWEQGQPLSWSDSLLRYVWRSRDIQGVRVALDLLAADANATIAHPLMSQELLAACAAWGGKRGFAGRASALKLIASDLLPDSVMTRNTKSSFNGAFWGRCSAEFAGSWDGTGVDQSIVDPDRLRAEWSGDDPDPHTFLLLHQAWLASR